MELLTNLFHLGIFGFASFLFTYAVTQRLLLISKAQTAGKLAPIEKRLRSFLLNVVFQFKLFKHPLRGTMHAFIFYGFLCYGIHTVSQMIAGNAWYFFLKAGIDPYAFKITDYIWLGFSLTKIQASVALLGLLASIVFTFYIMHSVKIGKHFNWRKNAALQWFFLLVLSLETGALFGVLTGSGTHFYELVVEYFSVLVLLGLAYFAYRRWLRRAKGLDVPSTQSAIVLLLIATLMLSTLVGEAANLKIKGRNGENWIETLFLFFLNGLGVHNTFTSIAVRNFSWWLHISTVYAFMVYVPLSKHSHLIFAPINFFLLKDRPWGQLSLLDLENENTVWGAANVVQLQWTSLLDSVSCIECGRCTIVCPANQTGKPLDPKKIMVDIKHSMIDNKATMLHSENASASVENLIGEPYISEEELWGCTSCHACVEACPVGNNQLDAIIDMRRNLVLAESRFPTELQTAFTNMENQSNPWGISSASREEWCADLGVKKMAQDSNVDVLYWAGCAASFDERNKKIARSFVSILQKAGINFGILGNEENCTGDSARRGGNEYLYQTLAQKNIETFNKYNVKNIVTACPHCYNTLKNEYSQLGGNYNVKHHSDYIDDLIRDKKIQLDKNKIEGMKDRRATYHDSCYLGRYNEIYEEPRTLVKKALGMDLAEPSDTKRTSLCCGAGGAQMWMEEKYERVNDKRTGQLVDTGADTIATACPFCVTMISDGIKNKHLSDDIKVLDVAELVAASMEGGTESLPLGFSSRKIEARH